MKKIVLIISIFLLILITSIVKNSTKKIEDQIFILNENIRSQRVELGDVLLEYNYLSSPEKLLQYQSQYFENELAQMNIVNIKKIIEIDNKLIKKDLTENYLNNE